MPAYGVSEHTTKKELHNRMKPFVFPNLTHGELKTKKIVYLLLNFPYQEVIIARTLEE